MPSFTHDSRYSPRTGLATASRARWTLLAFAGLLLAGGCKQEASIATSTSPRVAARAFVQAMVSGDEQAMRNVSVGDEPSARLLAAQARQNRAHEQLAAAARAKFGDETQVLVGRRAADHYASRLPAMDAESERIYDNGTAQVGAGPNTIHLKLVGTAWKVDRAWLVPPSADAAEHVTMIDAIRAADERVTAGIAAGKYATAAEARADLVKQMGDAVRSSMGQAQSQPTTRAASGPAEK